MKRFHFVATMFAAPPVTEMTALLSGPFTPELGQVILGTSDADLLAGTQADEILTGDDGNDSLAGDIGNDTLFGGRGDDLLSGGELVYDSDFNLIPIDSLSGADTMSGGEGDDVYLVNDRGDLVIELDDEGFDTVFASISYELSANVEKLVLTGWGNINGIGNDVGSILYGNDANNRLTGGGKCDDLRGFDGADSLYGGDDGDILYGGAGNDLLDGGSGPDDMYGDAGDDTYVVNDADDCVSESTNDGKDTVESSITYCLGPNVEILTLVGGAPINGKGNTLSNVITGNASENTLSGLDGADILYGNNGNDSLYGGAATDTLYGGTGDDVLNGGAGADTMIGGDGDDTYYVENSGDNVSETGANGHDQVYSSINFKLGALLEDLTLTGSYELKGTGNDLDNILTGNQASNLLIGDDGADTLNGGAGNDTLYGGLGADRLNGGTGADRLVGDDGDDCYIVDNSGDIVVEKANQGSDVVKASVNYTLLANFEALELTGGGSISGTGNSLDNRLIGNSGANFLNGMIGNDTVDGGDGNDKIVGGAGNDILTGGDGADTFVFEKTTGIDHVTDFTSSVDHINISSTLVNVLGGTKALNAGSFYAATEAVSGHDTDDRLIFNTTTGTLYYDVDGSEKKAAVQIAVLDMDGGIVPKLLFSDFIFG